MIINFNFKKYLKYFILFLLAYLCLHSFTDVKAYSNLSDNYIVDFNTRDYTNLQSFFNHGNADNLDSYYTINFNKPNFLSYYDKIKQKIATYRGYNSWNDLLNDYYFISMFRVQDTSSHYLDIFIYLCRRDSSTVNLFNPAIAAAARNTSSPNNDTEFYISFGAMYANYGYYWQVDPDDFNSLPGDSEGIRYLQYFCKNDNNYLCKSFTGGYNDSDNITHIYLRTDNRINVINNFYDSNKSNLSLYFSNLGSSQFTNNYVYQKAILNNNTNNVFSLITPLVDNFITPLVNANIQDLGNNSYGVNSNYVSISSIYSNSSDYNTISCPGVRSFNNDICYVYSSDIMNFDINNTSLVNRVRYFLESSNSISVNSSDYYILTLRVYSPYNLSISSLYLSSGNTSSPTDILSVKVNDFYTYRDYQIIFKANVSSSQSISFVDILFNNYSSLTDSLPSDFSFGVFSSIKFSSFSSLPTDSDISSDYLNNNLTSISSNTDFGFFNNFSFNDRNLSSFILLPLNYVRNLKNLSCSSISLPINHIGNFDLPCVSSFMSTNFNTIWVLYKLIFNGFFIYRILIHLFADIRNLYRPDNDRIEVLDL